MSDDGPAAFLRARLDEDEARAEAAKRVQTSWYVACDDDTITIDALREHIGHCSPARVLREVEAKRAVVALDEEENPAAGPEYYSGLYAAMMALAGGWSDHPDYRPEWKP